MKDKKGISSDLLYQFIKESIQERYILFSFIDLQTLSDENFKELATGFRENSSKSYYDYFKYDFSFINSLKEDKIELMKKIENLMLKGQYMESEKKDLINLNEKIEENLDKIQDEKNQLQDEKNQLQDDKNQLQDEKDQIQDEKEKLEIQSNTFFDYSETTYSELYEQNKKKAHLSFIYYFYQNLFINFNMENGLSKDFLEYKDERGVY